MQVGQHAPIAEDVQTLEAVSKLHGWLLSLWTQVQVQALTVRDHR